MMSCMLASHFNAVSFVSQDSIRFVQQVVTEDYSKVKGIPSDCSEIMVWRVDAPSSRQIQGNNRR
jgi:hypothetical protein